jgi:hypothetical protein
MECRVNTKSGGKFINFATIDLEKSNQRRFLCSIFNKTGAAEGNLVKCKINDLAVK